MLSIQTFDNRSGGNVLYKALAHPLVADMVKELYGRLGSAGPLAMYDPDGIGEALFAMYPDMPPLSGVFVHDVTQVGQMRLGFAAAPLTDLPTSAIGALLIAAFDTDRIAARIRHLLPPDAKVYTFDEVKLPAEMRSVSARYLDKLNFATNFAFFRDAEGLCTRLVSANYWSNYGAGAIRLWLRLFDADGAVLATWEQEVGAGPCGFAIDSSEVRRRFDLPPFTGQLFIHAIGAAGHDVVKYAVDIYASDNGASLSCTHDANAWPSDRYAGLPAPRDDERVMLWVQNSHAAPIPAGAIALDRMGDDAPVPYAHVVGPYATVAVDVAALLPGLRWPAQMELRAGRHVVRPRYEVVRRDRTRIAHVNVERSDLRPDPGIATLPKQMGRGYLLPFPILPRDRFRSIAQPTPMAISQSTLPLRVDVFDEAGTKVEERFLGCLPRGHNVAINFDDAAVEVGHGELVYDFRAGGEADGWLHALFRYEDRRSGHAAESSFGGHIFNTVMTYRDEPQSYSGPPPGLSTRLFLKLGDARRRSFAVLIYPASAAWHAQSSTNLCLYAGGQVVAEQQIEIPCSGSRMVWPHEVFGEAVLRAAGRDGYVLIDDRTCRLFGYHGLMDDAGGFSLDHMFGF